MAGSWGQNLERFSSVGHPKNVTACPQVDSNSSTFINKNGIRVYHLRAYLQF